MANGDTSDATDLNTPLADIEADLNVARPIVAGGTGATSKLGAQQALDLEPGVDIQPYDEDLAAIAALGYTSGAYLLKKTAAGTFSLIALTAAGEALLDDANAAAQLVTLGAQASDPTLISLSGLSLAEGDVLYATGADTLARLAKGTALQTLRMNAGATAPEWSEPQFGISQTWQNLLASRTAGVSYQNTTGRSIMIAVTLQSNSNSVQASTDNSTWITLGAGAENALDNNTISAVIPNNHYYRATGGTLRSWAELR